MQSWEVRATRLIVQRLAGPPAPDPVTAVRESLAVQSQDVPLAHDSLAQRIAPGSPDPLTQAQAALDAGRVVRTHVLRPTWHHVAVEDVRWLLELTAARTLSSMGARHRSLGLADPASRTTLLDALADALAAGPRTRAELLQDLAEPLGPEHPDIRARLTHLLLIAEQESLVCSGPARSVGGAGHTYALMDTVVPPAAPRPREEALADLLERFVRSHGPVALTDLRRWVPLPLREARAILATLPAVAACEVDRGGGVVRRPGDRGTWPGHDRLRRRDPREISQPCGIPGLLSDLTQAGFGGALPDLHAAAGESPSLRGVCLVVREQHPRTPADDRVGRGPGVEIHGRIIAGVAGPRWRRSHPTSPVMARPVVVPRRCRSGP